MDLINWYYEQNVKEDELDDMESLIEKAIGKILEDQGFEQYLMKYLKPTETGTPDMYIHVAANAAYVKESVAITHLVPVRWATTQDINCALDYLAVSTIPSAGNKRYISVFAKFVRDESNQKIDGHALPIWYNRDEGFEIEVWSGVEDPSPSKLALKSETYVLLFDVLLDENSTAISEPADWDNPVVDEIDITRVLYSEQILKKASSQTIDSIIDFLKSIKVDTITESTTDNGVDIEGNILKDNQVETDTIVEKTLDAGVDIETVHMEDGVIILADTTESTDKDTGSIITEGGIGVEKNINAGGTIKNADTTESTDKDTGAIVTEGGIGIEKNLNVGGATGLAEDLTLATGKDVKIQGTGRVEHNGSNVSGYTISGEVLRTKILEIGDWNMDNSRSVAIAHGLTFSKIRHISALIRNDNNDAYIDFASAFSSGQTTAQYISVDATIVNIVNAADGLFDTVLFNSTSYNRGWVLIDYID